MITIMSACKKQAELDLQLYEQSEYKKSKNLETVSIEEHWATGWYEFKQLYDIFNKKKTVKGKYIHACYEVFKYACKSTSEYNVFMSYPQFKYLFNALDNKRVFQSYGEWRDVDCDTIDDTIKAVYRFLRDYLLQQETPVSTSISSDKLKDLASDESITMISGRQIGYLLETLNEYKDDEKTQQALDSIAHNYNLEDEYYKNNKHQHDIDYGKLHNPEFLRQLHLFLKRRQDEKNTATRIEHYYEERDELKKLHQAELDKADKEELLKSTIIDNNN